MKILITTDLYATATNGVVTSTKNLCRALRDQGHEVRVLTLSETVHSHTDGEEYYIRSFWLPFYPGLRMPLSLKRYVKELIRWKPDVIHSQCEFFSFPFARRIAARTGAPIVHTFHTMYEDYIRYVIPAKRLGVRIVHTFVGSRLRRAACVIAPTEKVAASLRNYRLGGVPVSVIPSGISLAKHMSSLAPEERARMRRALGIRPEEQVLINLGRLGHEKNLEEILTLYGEALARHPSLRLLIVGGGPAEETLKAKAEELGLGERAVFAGMVPPEEVQNYYKLGDLFVSASTSETQGLTYVEAAANALPLLCRYDPCLDGVIEEGKNGYAYRTAEEFHTRLDSLLSDREALGRMGEAAREMARQYDLPLFGERVETLYRQALRKN